MWKRNQLDASGRGVICSISAAGQNRYASDALRDQRRYRHVGENRNAEIAVQQQILEIDEVLNRQWAIEREGPGVQLHQLLAALGDEVISITAPQTCWH